MLLRMLLLFAVICVSSAYCQLQIKYQRIQNAAVVQYVANESNISPNLTNTFYRDIKTRLRLARISWLAPGEKLVDSRASEQIPRANIFKMLQSAGFLQSHQNVSTNPKAERNV